VIMRMISLGLGDVRAFPFLDSPGQKSIKDGFDLLRELGATERDGRKVSLTKTGRIMARMPLDPKISRMLIEAQREDCISEITVIASGLSVQDPRVRPIDQAETADRKHAAFKDPDSDFITLLNIWNRYFLALDDLKTQNRVRRYCRDNFLSYVRMREWRHIHSQISTILKEQKIRANKAVKNRRSPPLYDRIHRSILSGYLSNIALKKEKNLYQAARNREAMIFPGSSLFNRSPHWVVAAEMVRTSRLFARCAARIESEWLEPLGGKMCRYSYSDPHWEKNRGSVIANEQVSLYGLVIIPKRSVQYGRINPEVSHEIFIRSAIMDGQVKGSFPFLEHNRELIQQITAMEDKVRRKDILVSEERVLEFYSERLPGICDTVGLKNLLRKRGSDDFLVLSEDDLIISEPDHGVLSMFPDRMSINKRQFDLAYRFAPGQNDDGVTIKVPSTLASQVNTAALDWLVPGLLKEKVFTIIKGLPKRYRKQLVPVSESVNVIMTEMERTDQPLINCLGKFIYQRFKIDIPASAWPLAEIQDHLRIRISITDHKGREIKTGRDINILKEEIPSKHTKEKEAAIWKKAREKWEKKGIKFWDFGDLPDQISLGPSLNAYPALVPEVESLSLRLFSSYEEALKSHKDGVASLFLIYLKKDLKLVKKSLVLPEETRAPARYFGGRESFDKSLYNALINRLFCLDIRTEEAFNARAASLSPGLVKEEKA
ncbi:MAG: DUF3418 domain-containing protein, partial [Deltaproteobacteria bacterium]|nr:DUF3418 domain-containing protein [Deltaproteobacteria bacterium]